MRHIAWMIASLMVLAPAMAFAVPGTVEVDIDGTAATVNYDAEGMEVLSVDADLDFASLIFDVDVDGSPGILEVTFERSFFDSVFDDADDDFLILADGAESDFTELSTNAESRTLQIELPFGTDEVEVVGSEFGAIRDREEPTIDEPEVPDEPPIDEPEVPDEPVADEPPIDEPEILDEPIADEPKVMEPDDGDAKPKTQCGPGTVLKDGACVLDQTCGPGTVLKDGACVLDVTEKKPVGNNRDFVMGLAAAFIIAFVAMIILWMIGRAGKNKSPDQTSS